MSIDLMSKAWKTEQKGNDLLVLLALCDFANDDGELFPSLSTISKKAKVSKSTLSYILRAYEEIGVITREQRKRENGSDTSTIYKIITLKFDSIAYKKSYQNARKYIPNTGSQCEHPKPQCEHPQNNKNDEIVNTPNHIVNTQTANCEHLEPSILNHQVINHHLKNIQKEDDEVILKIKPKEIIDFYKENISNKNSKIKELKSFNALALLANEFEKILIGLKNYASDLPKDKFHTRNLLTFIQDKVYLDYQEAVKISSPTNTLAINDKKYTESENF